MSPDVFKFIPLAGVLAGLIVAFAFDPSASRAAWWGIPCGLLAGMIIQFALKSKIDAR